MPATCGKWGEEKWTGARRGEDGRGGAYKSGRDPGDVPALQENGEIEGVARRHSKKTGLGS